MLSIDGVDFDVHIHTKQRNKRMYLRMKDATTLLVTKPPLVGAERVNSFITERSAWILKQAQRIQAQAQRGEQGIHLLGAWYPFVVVPNSARLHVADGACVIPVPWTEIDLGVQRAWLGALYTTTLEAHIPHFLTRYTQAMDVQPTAVRFGLAKSKWGSCSAHGRLFFNLRLACCAIEVIEYVVVHELAHLRHLNHGTHFWQFVQQHCPEYKQRRKQLHTYSVA